MISYLIYQTENVSVAIMIINESLFNKNAKYYKQIEDINVGLENL